MSDAGSSTAAGFENSGCRTCSASCVGHFDLAAASCCSLATESSAVSSGPCLASKAADANLDFAVAAPASVSLPRAWQFDYWRG